MGSKEILKRLLELSKLQIDLFADRRYPELLKAQIERGELFEQLDKLKDEPGSKEGFTTLRDRVLESDKELTIRFSSEMEGLKTQLKKVAKGGQALKGYSGRINK